MGNLKPVGSEKLQGMDKIKRIMEIARYNEVTPTPINETSSVEYTKQLTDGNKYEIVKEKNGYVIKKQLSENSSEYIEPMKNRKYYSSYSQALKRLNLIIKEVNSLTGYDKNVSLFNESELDEKEKKYFLKIKAEEQVNPEKAPVAATPAPVEKSETPEPEVPSQEVAPEPEAEEIPEPEMETPEVPEVEETPEEKVTFKTIQKLTGKLGQKLRVLSSDDQYQMSSNDIKYVVNSILSALDLNKLDSDDKEEIVSKFDGEESEDVNVPEIGDEGEEVDIEAPEAPSEEEPQETEMGEEVDMKKKIEDIFSEDEDFEDEYRRFSDGMPTLEPGTEEEETITKPLPTINPDFDPFKDPDPSDDPEARRHRKFRRHQYNDYEKDFDAVFSESKVDSILKKYFKIDESEKKETKKVQSLSKEHKQQPQLKYHLCFYRFYLCT